MHVHRAVLGEHARAGGNGLWVTCDPRVHRTPGPHRRPRARAGGTHIKVVVAPHLDGELFADPRAHLRPALAIEPAAHLDLAHDPLALALLGQDPAEPGVVSRPPEDKGPEKEMAGEGARPEEEEDELGCPIGRG
jgi:hypothetical protein